MANKKCSKKYQFLVFVICSLLATLVCMAVLVVTVKNLDTPTNTEQPQRQSKTELTDNTADLLDYLKRLTVQATDNKFIKANIFTDISVDDGSIAVEGSQADKALLIYAKNKTLGAVDSFYPADTAGCFGEINSAIPTIDLSPADVIESRFSVGEADENGSPVYNSDTGELIDQDYYFITLTVRNSPSVSALFAEQQDAAVSQKLKKALSGSCAINSFAAKASSFKISAKINRFTDEIQYIIFEKLYSVSAVIDFKNELKFFGSKKIDFVFKVNHKYEYSYAGIRFSESEFALAPGEEVVLTVNAVIENDSDYKVTFTSSDPSVATVDEMGYVKGISASCEPVTITVTLEYLGEEFTDECTVIINNNENPNG